MEKRAAVVGFQSDYLTVALYCFLKHFFHFSIKHSHTDPEGGTRARSEGAVLVASPLAAAQVKLWRPF